MNTLLDTRLLGVLARVENSDNFMLFDQVAFLLAHFEKAEYLPIKTKYLLNFPKLLNQVDDCLNDLTVSIPKPQALIHAADYMNREDDLGEVATYLIKICRG